MYALDLRYGGKFDTYNYVVICIHASGTSFYRQRKSDIYCKAKNLDHQKSQNSNYYGVQNITHAAFKQLCNTISLKTDYLIWNILKFIRLNPVKPVLREK